MLNRVILIGRVTKDIELKHTQSNIAVAKFTLAVNRQFANEQGEREADFINCLAWRKTAELMNQYVSKGHQIAVEGRIQTGSYESDKGIIYTTEVVCDNVVFLEKKEDDGRNKPSDFADKVRDKINNKLEENDEMPF